MPHNKPASGFRDPLGLLLRMLRSRNKAAYSALLHEALRIAVTPLDYALADLDRRAEKSAGSLRHPLLLIVGPPRSGTTVIYQALAQYLDVTVPSNLTSLFPRAPLTATRLLGRHGRSTSPDLSNFYGQTSSLAGPNDAFGLWDRWLGNDRYNPAPTMSLETAQQMRRFFAAWVSAFDKPFLNKNNRNAVCVGLLARHLPEARFIVVQRQPLFIVQSLIKARQQVQGDPRTGWGLRCRPESDAADPLAYVDDVCRQVLTIERELQQQLNQLPAGRVLEISYEEFCARPSEVISDVVRAIPEVSLNPHRRLAELPSLQATSEITLSSAEYQRATQQLRQAGPTPKPSAALPLNQHA